MREWLSERSLSLAVSPGALGWLANVGYDPAYGARPVRRAVRQHMLNPLAQALLGFGRDTEGARVVVDALDGNLRIRVRAKDEPVAPDEGGEGWDVGAPAES